MTAAPPPRDARLRTLCHVLRQAQDEADDLGLDDLLDRLDHALRLAVAITPAAPPTIDLPKARRRPQ
ncbi:hypothetical protein ACM64Y_07505 [Novispirillum sp. DQ9]|uniref:hypothetical protein n=1 Tax=Novispirillum sp. DQ9 TaxID=3398612 RepID=UPI003C7CB22E